MCAGTLARVGGETMAWCGRVLDQWRPERNHRYSNPHFATLTTQNVVSTVVYARSDPEEAMEELELKRVLSTQSNGNEIPLRKFCSKAGFLSFQPPRFCAATCHIEDTTTQVFDRGSCVVVGSPSMEKVVWAAHQLRFYLRDQVGINLDLKGILLRNRVCSCRMNFAIDIQGFERHDYIGNVKQSDSFPGIIRKQRTKSGNEIVCLIFETGSCIAMGLVRKEDENEVQEVYDHILPLMLRNKKAAANTSRGQQRAVRKFTKQIEALFDPSNKSKQGTKRARKEEEDEGVIEKIIELSTETFPGNKFSSSSSSFSSAKRQKTKK